MTNTTWEKTPELAELTRPRNKQRYFYLAAFVGLVAVVAYLVVMGLGGARYYMTIDELVSDEDNIGKSVRVSGAVRGDYVFDQDTQTLTFIMVNIPNDSAEIREAGGLAKVLYLAVNDPNATPLKVVYHNAEVPDLLQHEAQAIVEGTLAFENGEYIFYADKVQLKCPTRYSEENPERVADEAEPKA
jgi:cytochrome c-type biogenesis protein CcmE